MKITNIIILFCCCLILSESIRHEGGSEFPLQAGFLQSPKHLSLSNGNILIVYQYTVGGIYKLQGYIIDPNGIIVQPPFKIGPDSNSFIISYRILSIPNGKFVAYYSRNCTSQSSILSYEIYDESGVKIAPETNLTKCESYYMSSITSLSNGNILASWGNLTQYNFRILNPDGTNRTDQIIIKQIGTRILKYAHTVRLPDEKFVIVWQQQIPQTTTASQVNSVRCVIYDANGMNLTQELIIYQNVYEDSYFLVAVLSNGNLLIVNSFFEIAGRIFNMTTYTSSDRIWIQSFLQGTRWMDLESLEPLSNGNLGLLIKNGTKYSLKILDSNGTPISPLIELADDATIRTKTQVALFDRNVIFVYSRLVGGNGYGIFAKIIEENGRVSPEMSLNYTTSQNQLEPSVALLKNSGGKFLVTWFKSVQTTYYPFINETFVGRIFTPIKCPNLAHYYNLMTQTCDVTCPPESMAPTLEDGIYKYCENCPPGIYYFTLNRTCIATCPSKLFSKAKRSGYDFCDFICGPGLFYYPLNGSCLSSCSSPFQAVNESNYLYCNFPCPQNIYYNATSNSCQSTCLSSTGYASINRGNHLLCEIICPKGLYFFSLNGTCIKDCPQTYLKLNYSGNLFCNFPCGTDDYLYFDGTCSTKCELPYKQSISQNRKTCIYPCIPPKVLNFDGRCVENCLYPPNIQAQSRKSCESCDTDKLVCRLGTTFGPKEGYWIFNSSTKMIQQCPYPPACRGNSINISTELITSRGSCADGYRGNLCANCQPGWGHLSNGKCELCSSSALYYVQILGPLLVNIALFIFSVSKLSKKNATTEEDAKSVKQSIMIRMLMNFLQINSLLKDVNIAWPEFIMEFFSYGKTVGSASQGSVTADCMLDYDDSSSKTFAKNVLTLFSPLIFTGLLGIFWLAKYYKNRDKESLINLCITSLIVVIFNMIPNILQQNLKFMDCRNIYNEDKPEYYYTDNYDMQCWVGDHQEILIYVIIPSLILWMIIAPYFLFRVLKFNKERLREPEMISRFSFIYNGYRTDCFYWEFIILFRKVLTICIVVFVKSAISQIILSYLLLGIFIFTHTVILPYEDKKLNYIESYGMLSSIFLLLSAIFFLYREQSASIGDYEKIFVFLMLFGTISFFLVLFVEFFSTAINPVLQKVLQKIKKAKSEENLQVKSEEQLEEKSKNFITQMKSKTSHLIKKLKNKISPNESITKKITEKFPESTLLKIDEESEAIKEKTLITPEKIKDISFAITPKVDQISDFETENSPQKKLISSRIENPSTKKIDFSLLETSPAKEHRSKTYVNIPNVKKVELKHTFSTESLILLDDNKKLNLNVYSFSKDGKYFASIDPDQKISIWNTVTGKSLITLAGHAHEVSSLAFSPENIYIASSSKNNIKIWSVKLGKCLKSLEGHTLGISCLSFPYKSKTLASGSLDGSIKIWKVVDGICIHTLARHSKMITSLTFSPNGKQLASASRDKSIKIWDSETGNLLETLAGHKHWVTCICYAPDGAILASSSEDLTIKVWDIRNKRCKQTMTGHEARIYTVTFSKDCKYLASGSSDKSIRIWDVSTGKNVLTIEKGEEHFNPVTIWDQVDEELKMMPELSDLKDLQTKSQNLQNDEDHEIIFLNGTND